MGTIYENAYLTIAATWSHNSDGGLFHNMSSLYRPMKMETASLYVRVAPVQLRHIPFGKSTDKLEVHWPLLTRAWVLQERQLSARMVHFDKRQIHWECRPGIYSEGSFIRNGLRCADLINPVDQWRSMILHYTQLNLSYESDRLPALAAIVERTMVRRKDSQYVAGMWTDTIALDLGWCCDGKRLPRPANRMHIPSWSWASTQGRTMFIRYEPGRDLLVGLTYTPNGPTALGGVLDARLCLQGPSFTMSITKSLSDRDQRVLLPWEGWKLCRYRSDFEYSSAERLEAPSVSVSVLVIGKSWIDMLVALMLHKTGDYWERIGLASLKCYGRDDASKPIEELLAFLPVEEFTII